MEHQFHIYLHVIFEDHKADSKLLHEIQKGIVALGEKMSKTDDQIAAFEAKTNTQLASISKDLGTMASAQANIAGDEAKILDELKNMPTDGLSPASLAILDGVTSKLDTVATSSATQAKGLQDLADSIPDTVVQP